MLITRSTKIKILFFALALLAVYIFDRAVHFCPTDFLTVSGFIVFYGILVSAWTTGVWIRIPNSRKRILFLILSGNFLIFLMMQICKYAFFSGNLDSERYIWYGSYIPIIIIPLVSFNIAQYIGLAEGEHPRNIFRLLNIVAALLVLIVMTNDLHQKVFTFTTEVFNDNDYKYGVLYIPIVLWSSSLMIIAFAIAISRTAKSVSRRYIWLPIIPLLLAFLFAIISATGNFPRFHGRLIFHYQEFYTFCIIIFWEICIQIGLLRSNSNQGELMNSSLSRISIVDDKGSVQYSTANKIDIDFTKPIPEMLDEHTRLHEWKIDGGKTVWANDISGLIKTQEELLEIRERLSEEGDILIAEKEYQEELARVKARSELYDDISLLLKDKINKVREILSGVSEYNPEEIENKESEHRNAMASVSIIAAYIKRRSNLEILLQSESKLSIDELRLSLEESMDYIRLRGVRCVLESAAKSNPDKWTNDKIIEAYESFEDLVEEFVCDLSEPKNTEIKNTKIQDSDIKELFIKELYIKVRLGDSFYMQVFSGEKLMGEVTV